MKKIFICMMAVAAMVSCNKNNITPEQAPAPAEKDLITFGVSDLGATKAVSESDVTTLESTGFNVAGIISDQITYFNELASKSGSEYVTAKKYYYPTGKSMDFYACHPVSRTITVNNGVATLAYTQNNSEDLIVAKKENVTAQSGAVAMTFEHILSQLMFTATGTDPHVDYYLKSITVTAPNGGTYRYADNTWERGAGAAVAYYSGNLPVSTSAATSVNEVMTFLPGQVQITVSWECFIDGQLIETYTKSTPAIGQTGAIVLDMGKKNTINLSLPNADALNIAFSVSVTPWGATSQDVTLN
ncbi:MAG: fimbrillin family protein [Bacteroidales bacterium]|nr:fimbrillin family protein [Bacteroidales bacterium]